MKKIQGFSMIEALIALGITGILATVAVVAYIGYQRSVETVDALATVSLMRERFAVMRSQAGETLIDCDDSLVRDGDLESDFLELKIAALPLDETDLTKGYGGGLIVTSRVDKQGADGVRAVQQLMEELGGDGTDVRDAVITESAASFTVLLTSPSQPHCQAPMTIASTTDASNTGTAASSQPALPIAPPNVSISLSAEQEIFNTGSDGRAVIDSVKTGGDLDELTLEFSVVGKAGGSATASTGPVIFNYGTNANNNLISAWRPSNFTIALQGKDYATGIDLTDGQSHRVTIGWDAASGSMKVYDNGVLEKEFNNVSPGSAIPGDGYLALAQKMNNPGSRSGWTPGEHYSGQIFGTSLATRTYTDAEVAGAPLYTRSGDLVADIRTEGGKMIDHTGQHTVEMQGSPTISSVDVNTDLALIPPGSKVKVSVSAAPGDSRSTIRTLAISGLNGLTLTDSSGNTGSGNFSLSGWDLGSLEIQLPPGFSSNVTLNVFAVARGDDGKMLSAGDSAVLRMAP